MEDSIMKMHVLLGLLLLGFLLAGCTAPSNPTGQTGNNTTTGNTVTTSSTTTTVTATTIVQSEVNKKFQECIPGTQISSQTRTTSSGTSITEEKVIGPNDADGTCHTGIFITSNGNEPFQTYDSYYSRGEKPQLVNSIPHSE